MMDSKLFNIMRTFFAVSFLPFVFLSFILLIGCQISKDLRPLSELEESQRTVKKGYFVRPGDLLNVQVWGEQKLSGEIKVRDDGRITIPLINDVDAAAQTLEDLSGDIAQKLESFVPGAQVTVSVSQQAPIHYFLSGSFIKPGEYTSTKEINLIQAIATGNGFAPFANDSSILLIRKSAQREMRYNLSYDDVVNGEEPNPTIRDGDIISVR